MLKYAKDYIKSTIKRLGIINSFNSKTIHKRHSKLIVINKYSNLLDK